MNSSVSPRAKAARPRRSAFTPDRLGVYAFLISASAFFLLPLYVMVVTSLKTGPEVREAILFGWPSTPQFQNWIEAWSTACISVDCTGIQKGFWNSVRLVIPATVLSVLLGALNGYALSFWRSKWGDLLFAVLMLGAFVPFQVMIYPLVAWFRLGGFYNTYWSILLVHCIFGMPVLTLLFRNYYVSVPQELFKAARIDGGGFWRIFLQLMLPMATPMLVVATILQLTGIWNDYLFGLLFAGKDNYPMTVQLNNLVNTTFGERRYHIDMAATILTSLVPLAVYFFSGRWFVRGIAAGAVKG
ncbi:MAG: carbohydrate ABC transporter permease [Rhodoferax sp.]|nr:carbohydrate ABC transporter permease [Rhodoferax sp.]